MATELLPLRVAIVGGGVSGLSSAYYLLRDAQPGDRPLHIDIYERKRTLGGNADTVVVDLGDYIDGDGKKDAYLRWADLGVNDVNLDTYHRLKALMTEINYLQHMKPLQDTASYFSRDGALALTDDSALRYGVSDPRFSLDEAEGGQLSLLSKVLHQSALDLIDRANVTPQYTVGRFFDDCIADPENMLAAAAGELRLPVSWSDPRLPARLAQVRDQIYYPRIAAMYFTDERGPHTLPLQSPFEYYRLQEGPPGAIPDRRYFEHGAQKWLEALAEHITQPSGKPVTVRIHHNAGVRVHVEPGRVRLRGDGMAPVSPLPYDLCVLAAHADDTMALLSFDADMGGWRKRIDAILSQVSYTRGYAVCHTFDGVMPQNKNIWRTYNVLQREPGDATFPYRMSYVANLHQNDPVNPQRARACLPLYFVSLVSSLDEIPRHTMLDRAQGTSRIKPALLAALPLATQQQLAGAPVQSGYRLPGTELHAQLTHKAWTMFKHNVLDAACIASQQAMQSYNLDIAQGIARGRPAECALLFGGGWTLGAGLQEQCLAQSSLIAGWIAPALRRAVSPAAAPAPGFAANAA